MPSVYPHVIGCAQPNSYHPTQVAPLFRYIDDLVGRGLGVDEVITIISSQAVKYKLTLTKARELWAYKQDAPFVVEVKALFG